ncbi:glycosyltransferase family 4 protein [Chitiniphilus purpureus]|uniref:Glycosyltransferase family 4 protein n=1 Tax=Chitiniphilus purpureus TaxID=2981137 RepID=A0ABY6DJE0_9NEIS|nr:glycosyltransferase family 4 protein [Chitiniphilus sp. CD1]UXY14476.1 glycosyltransferase family 4 protein [Chitiniphilus sp. CD1]
MHVLFLSSSLGPGGAERVATTLCNSWVDRGDSVTLVPTFSGGGQPFYPLRPQIELLYLADQVGAAKSGWRSYFGRFNALLEIARSRHPDVIVSFLPNVNVVAVLLSAATGIPCIISERSDPAVQPLGTFWRMCCKALYRFADAVVVQTDNVAASVVRRYGNMRRVSVVPNPIPPALEQYRADGRAIRTRRCLLSLGRLSHEKQVGAVIDCFASLAGGFAEWDLHIYGDGPEREALSEQIIRLGMGDRVFLMGGTETPWAVMADSDLFVMNSRYEGFPNALLEAMAIGLPCVTADCRSGPREISADGRDAMLFAPGDVMAMQSALATLMADSALRNSLGLQARAAVLSRYSLAAILHLWDREMIAVRGRRR